MPLPRTVRPGRVALAALVAVLVAGCGTTVRTQAGAAVPGGADGLSAPAPGQGPLAVGADGTVTGGPGTAAGGTVAAAGATAAGTAALGSTGGARGAAAGGSSATSGRGGRATAPGRVAAKAPIKVGVITQQQLEEAAKSFGLEGVTTGDTKKQVEAVVAWIKGNGGFGGHPVQVIEHAVDLSDGSNAVIQNKACTAMAEDHKVQFVVTVLGALDILVACLSKFGIGLLADNSTLGDKTMAKYAPWLGNPSELGIGRMQRLLVDDLVRRSWLTPASKIGVLALDSPDGHAAVDGPLATALRRHGLKAASTVYINPNTGDGGSSQSSSAVLRFRADGVDRVLPVMYSPAYFSIAAESQGYQPAYAMTSSLGPGALHEMIMPANQLENSAGIGWAPFLDIGKGPRPPAINPRQSLCFDIMDKAGQGAASALVKGFQAQVCDMVFYLKDLTDLRPDLPRDLLTSARRALGARFVSPATYRVDVSKRTDGVAGYRPLAYLESCECFQYVGPLVAAP